LAPRFKLIISDMVGAILGPFLSRPAVHLRGMCNDYEQSVSWAQYRAAMRAADIAIGEHQGGEDLPPAADVWIGNTGPVARQADDVVELVQMRFGMAPATPRGGPFFNLRSEGRHFADSNRCLVIASGFYEFTGTGYPKTKHRFTLNDAPCMAIAGIWRTERRLLAKQR
jgi:putative SOS response-associated peptidase YedK